MSFISVNQADQIFVSPFIGDLVTDVSYSYFLQILPSFKYIIPEQY
jgi:hypothetical protein